MNLSGVISAINAKSGNNDKSLSAAINNLDLAEKINDIDFGESDAEGEDDEEDDLMGMYNDMLDEDN